LWAYLEPKEVQKELRRIQMTTESVWNTESESQWEREPEKTPKQLLMSYIIYEVKNGTSKEELLDSKILEYLKQNGMPKIPKSEAVKMIDWAIEKFGGMPKQG
jgi:hypothetical protein